MRYSEKLQSAIQEQNVGRAQMIILSYLDNDSQSAHPQALQIAKEIAGLFKNPDEPFFEKEDHLLNIPSVEQWDSAFLIKIKAALQTNFSQEKLQLAEKVILELRRRGLPDYQVREKKNTLKPPTPPHNPTADFMAGAIVGGIVLGGAGLIIGLLTECTLKATLGGILIGGVAGGLLNQKKKHR